MTLKSFDLDDLSASGYTQMTINLSNFTLSADTYVALSLEDAASAELLLDNLSVEVATPSL